jgi:hypothetical protein
MIKTAAATAWRLEVERGPDWLFVRLCPDNPRRDLDEDLFERVLHAYEEHFVHRLVLEMDAVPGLSAEAIDHLSWLHASIDDRGGLLRVCGLRPSCERALRRHMKKWRLSSYGNREDAICGVAHTKPR